MSRPVSPPSPALPRGIRFAAAVCLVLSGITGLFSLKEALELGRLSQAKEAQLARLPSMGTPRRTRSSSRRITPPSSQCASPAPSS